MGNILFCFLGLENECEVNSKPVDQLIDVNK